MDELRKEAYGPEGDAARHLPLDELTARLAALPHRRPPISASWR